MNSLSIPIGTKDPEDRVIIYDEYYKRHRTVEGHAKHLNGKLDVSNTASCASEIRNVYEYTTCDPSGASARATLLENGILTVAVRSNVLQGLEAVRQLLRVRADGKPGQSPHRARY